MTQLACGSYNLKNGGIDHGDDRRLRRQLAMLAGIGADAWFLQEMAGLGLRLVLATNATAAETRWPALQMAGVHKLFAVGLISYSLNVRKSESLFYELVSTAAQCPPHQVLFAGNSIPDDVAGPMQAGMQACLVRPDGLRPGEDLPDGALLIGHVAELPGLLETL